MLKKKFLFWTLESVWLEVWKSERIENGERIEKFLDFARGVWFKSIKVEDRKYNLYKFTFMSLINK